MAVKFDPKMFLLALGDPQAADKYAATQRSAYKAGLGAGQWQADFTMRLRKEKRLQEAADEEKMGKMLVQRITEEYPDDPAMAASELFRRGMLDEATQALDIGTKALKLGDDTRVAEAKKAARNVSEGDPRKYALALIQLAPEAGIKEFTAQTELNGKQLTNQRTMLAMKQEWVERASVLAKGGHMVAAAQALRNAGFPVKEVDINKAGEWIVDGQNAGAAYFQRLIVKEGAIFEAQMRQQLQDERFAHDLAKGLGGKERVPGTMEVSTVDQWMDSSGISVGGDTDSFRTDVVHLAKEYADAAGIPYNVAVGIVGRQLYNAFSTDNSDSWAFWKSDRDYTGLPEDLLTVIAEVLKTPAGRQATISQIIDAYIKRKHGAGTETNPLRGTQDPGPAS